MLVIDRADAKEMICVLLSYETTTPTIDDDLLPAAYAIVDRNNNAADACDSLWVVRPSTA